MRREIRSGRIREMKIYNESKPDVLKAITSGASQRG